MVLGKLRKKIIPIFYFLKKLCFQKIYFWSKNIEKSLNKYFLIFIDPKIYFPKLLRKPYKIFENGFIFADFNTPKTNVNALFFMTATAVVNEKFSEQC